ncbi:MAG: hypothetical protein KTV45_12480 [Acidimicrobiia bacterium]|nr:hypothetical protein [Acidimicrobiia bacterium]
MADLDWLRAEGLDRSILGARQDGVPVIGICAGFQMLGTRLLDPHRRNGRSGRCDGRTGPRREA